MDYGEWAAEYLENADRVKAVIEKKRTLLNDKKLTADERKTLSDTIKAYRGIYRDLLRIAGHLRQRGERYHAA